MDALRMYDILVAHKLVPDVPFVTLTAIQLMHLDNLAGQVTEEATVEGSMLADEVEELRRRSARQQVVIQELRTQLHRAERTEAGRAAQLVIPFADSVFRSPE